MGKKYDRYLDFFYIEDLTEKACFVMFFRALYLFHLQSVVEHLLQTHCRSTSVIKMVKAIQYTW